MAFRKVWNNRHQLQGFFNPFNENPFEGTVTTEVDVTTYARRDSALKPAGHTTDADPAIPGTEPAPTAGFDPYSVNVEAGPPAPPHRHHRSDPSSASAAPDLLRVRALTRTAALRETNPEAWLYARVAFLFFGALLLSWVPSSANRLYALAHPARYSFGLNYAEALVLPLQGFCNALVYAVTSRSACRDLWRSVAGTGGGGGGAVGGKGPSGGGKGADTRLERFAGRRTSRRLESDESSVASLRGH